MLMKLEILGFYEKPPRKETTLEMCRWENNIKMDLRELECADMVVNWSIGCEAGNEPSGFTGGGSFLTI
jgi:hypothetical protein